MITNDNDIIKALEHCSENGECKDCLANPHKGNYGYCVGGLMKRAIDLINRQKAEIERLQKQLDSKCDRCIARDRTEAIKEFAEKVKEKSDYCYLGSVESLEYRITAKDFESLVKELTEDQK